MAIQDPSNNSSGTGQPGPTQSTQAKEYAESVDSDVSYDKHPEESQPKSRSLFSKLLKPHAKVSDRRTTPGLVQREQRPPSDGQGVAFPYSSNQVLLKDQFRVDIRTQSGKTLPFVVEPSTNINYLKEQVADVKGKQPHKLLLIFNGELLGDDQSLGDFAIQDQSMIYLMRYVQEPQGMLGKPPKQ